MKKLFSEFYDFKLCLYNNERVIIENYKTVVNIEDNSIQIDNVLILGNFLKITKLDNIKVEIIGDIHEISLI